jgi:hypothetical protein
MAYKNHNVVVWIPYGRESTVSILFNYLMANKDIVDEVWLCMNTDPEQESDRAYAESLSKANPDFVKLKKYDGKRLEPKQLNTGKFYKQMIDPNTIYIRMDDDMVYLHEDYFKNMLDYRLNHPEYLITFGHIWNNSIISYIQQNELKNLDDRAGIVREKFAMDAVAWMSPTFAEYIHETLLDKIESDTVQDLYFKEHILEEPQRFSVGNFAHFGKKFAEFDGDLKGAEEEIWLTEVYPRETGLRNSVCGTAMICHWAFFAQRPHLENNTNFLDKYKKISMDKLSASYYRLLNDSNNNAR